MANPQDVIRDEFESMVGTMYAQKQAKDVVASLGGAVKHTGEEQVAARPVGDMSRGHGTGVV